MDKTVDAAAGIDCSLMGDLAASGYRQSLTAN
jgi:NitT/TauT family transport system substrate-binding protein